jgi:uncharacterized protein YlxP (DUF503 family)
VFPHAEAHTGGSDCLTGRGSTGCGKSGLFCHSERSEESLLGLLVSKEKEIPRSARNDKKVGLFWYVFAGMKMPIGLLTLEIYIPEAHSLKDKRQVLRSLKDRLRGKFNVAVAELEGQDSWQRSVVGVVSLANNAGFLEQSLRTVLEESEKLLGRDLVGHELEVL